MSLLKTAYVLQSFFRNSKGKCSPFEVGVLCLTMALIPQGVVTIQNTNSHAFMLTCEGKPEDKRRQVTTSIRSNRPFGPQEQGAAQWNIVQRFDTFCIQNVMTKEWMYANASKDDDKRRPVLTYERGFGGDPPQDDLSFRWHFVRFGASFGIKSAKHDEWLYDNGGSHVLAWVAGGNDPKVDSSASWLIQPVAAFPGASLKHDLVRSSIVVRVQSSGYNDGNTAAIYLDGILLEKKYSRGLNIAVLEPTGFQVKSSRTYDIWDSCGERNQLVVDLEALPIGCIVLAALQDSGMEKLSRAEWKVLQDLGSMFTNGQRRQGYALIGTKGGKAVAEAQGQAVTVTGTIISSIPSPQGLVRLCDEERAERARSRSPRGQRGEQDDRADNKR